MPALGELAAEIAGSELNRIVGVSEFTDFPNELKKVKKIGSYRKISFEEIVALKPDLILASLDGNGQDPIQHLKELGMNVVAVATDSFVRIQESMRIVGSAMGNPKKGEYLAQQFAKNLSQIQERTKKGIEGHARKKVLIELSHHPLIVAGRQSFLDDALEAIGTENVYHDLQAAYPRPSLEDVISSNPDVIVIFGMSIPPQLVQEMIEEWNRFPSLKAVQTHQIRVIRDDSLVRPTSRLIHGLELLEKAIYETH